MKCNLINPYKSIRALYYANKPIYKHQACLQAKNPFKIIKGLYYANKPFAKYYKPESVNIIEILKPYFETFFKI